MDRTETARTEIALRAELKRVQARAREIAVQNRPLPADGELREGAKDGFADMRTALVGDLGQLRRRYIGFKSYDRWAFQREDTEYGGVPRHGSIVFSMGLVGRFRGISELSPTAIEVEAALYALDALEHGAITPTVFNLILRDAAAQPAQVLGGDAA